MQILNRNIAIHAEEETEKQKFGKLHIYTYVCIHQI